MTKKMDPSLAGKEFFEEFYRTGHLARLYEGHAEYRRYHNIGFVDKLSSYGGGQSPLHNEFGGIEYEMKLSVREKPNNKTSLSIHALNESVLRTFTGSKRYLADGATAGSFTDVHYWGKDGKEILLYEEGPPRVIKQKIDLRFMVNMPEIARIVKRRETMKNSNSTIDDLIHCATYAAQMGGTCPGRAKKGKSDIDVFDTHTGRAYRVTASETYVDAVTNSYPPLSLVTRIPPMFQLEVEYLGHISALSHKRPYYPDDAMRAEYENEEQVVSGITSLGMFIRNKIAWDPKRSFLLEPTNKTKYQYIRDAYGDRSQKMFQNFIEGFGLTGAQ